MSPGATDRVVVSGRPVAIGPEEVVETVERVLRGEGQEGRVEVAFLGRDRMSELNGRWKGARRPTDVLAFVLHAEGESVLGDVYICPWVARRSAARRGVPVREELIRLVVHGTLHVLGWDHPDGEDRMRSPMWRRQESYVRAAR